MSSFFRPLLLFLFELGYFGPLVMGVLSSFLVLPFGNDFVLVGLIAQHPAGIVWYVLSATVGSTLGVLLLGLVARKFGEHGISKVAGEKRFEMLKKSIGRRSGLAIVVASIAPPPFPYTLVIAAASALGFSIWRLMVINFFARAVRFTIFGLLALKFGKSILQIARTAPFFWSMVAFILLCLVASVFSILHWVRSGRAGRKQ